MRILVQVNNQTSKTRVGAGSRVYGSISHAQSSPALEVRLREIPPTALVLDVPARTAAQGHVLDILVEVLGIGKPMTFSVKGRAMAPVEVGEGRERLQIELFESRDPSLDRLRKILAKRQEEIDAFISSMRR
ncbi:MAG TPA: hypothetical protein VM598_10800 [Bdellovibrionota bacterium]|nr:hypothetical protein [Bdellovibrionota bacterium]